MKNIHGIAGCHRVGKTTLMDALTKNNSAYRVLRSDVAGVLKARGTNAKTETSFAERLEHQQAILDYHIGLWKDVQSDTDTYVTDRTPLCFMGYTLYDLPRSLTHEEGEVLADFLEQCVAAQNTYFVNVMILQPGIKAPEDDKSAGAHPAIQFKFNAILRNLALRWRDTLPLLLLDPRVTDLQQRIDLASRYFTSTTRVLR